MNEVTRMKKVAKGTRVDRDETVEGRVLTKSVVTQHGGRDGPYYLDTWTFDFSKVTTNELLVLATRSLVIEVQGRFRRAKAEDLKGFDGYKCSVREYLDKKRRGKSAEERKKEAMDIAKKLSREELLALLEEKPDES